jgi:hypothetical protein
MHWSLAMCLGIVLVGMSGRAMADDPSHCDKIIEQGLREYSMDVGSSSYLHTAFVKNCTYDGKVKSTNGSFNIPGVAEGAGEQNESAVKQWCLETKDKLAIKESHDTVKETIAARAYDSYDACLKWAGKQIDISLEYGGQEIVVAHIDGPTKYTPLYMSKIEIVGKASCSDNSGLRFYDNQQTEITTNFVIKCRRTENTAKNPFKYDGVQIILSASNGPGPFIISMPAVAADWKIKELEESIRAEDLKALEPIVPQTLLVTQYTLVPDSGGQLNVPISCPPHWTPSKTPDLHDDDDHPFQNWQWKSTDNNAPKSLKDPFVITGFNHAGKTASGADDVRLAAVELTCLRGSLDTMISASH